MNGLFVDEIRQNGFRELLAKLNPHLVKGIDVPNGALNKDLMLVEGDEAAQRLRGQLFVEQ